MISSPEKSKNQNNRKYIGKHTFKNVLVQYVVTCSFDYTFELQNLQILNFSEQGSTKQHFAKKIFS